MQLTPTGEVLLIWPGTGESLLLVRVGANGEVLEDSLLPIAGASAHDPQMHVGADGRLHLLWRERRESGPAVHYALLEPDGTPVVGPQVLSDPTDWALHAPQLAADTEGHVHILWTSRAGIEWVVLSAEGARLAGPILLVPGGRYPAVQTDGSGRLHLAWQRALDANRRSIYYARLDSETGELAAPQEVGRAFRSLGQRIEGPVISLGLETVHVLWGELGQSSGRIRHAFFPLGQPEQAQTGALQLARGQGPREMRPLEGQQPLSLVTFSEFVPLSSGDLLPQVAVASLGPGWTPEEIVTASEWPSVDPVLAADGGGNLHLVWLEPGGFEQYRVTYASTAPEVRRNYDAVTAWDVVNPVLTRIFRLPMVIMALVPMLLRWVVIPFVGVIVYHLLTGDEWLDHALPRVVLVVTLALEVTLTLLMPLRIETASLELTHVAPVVTAVIAGLILARFLLRPEDKSLFAAFLLFTSVHVPLAIAAHFLLS